MTKPLVPEDIGRLTASAREQHIATLVRAVIAVGRNALDRRIHAVDFAKKAWPNDRHVADVLRAAASPMTMANATAFTPIAQAFLPALVPLSAGADLLQRGLGLNFDGAAQISMPSISVPVADFVGEMAPIPVQPATTGSGTTLVPHKLAVISTLTSEMLNSSNAEAMVRQVLVESTGPAIDRVLFSTNPAGADRPAGLLNGITPLNPAAVTGGKVDALEDDLQALATAVAPVAGNNQIAIIAAAAQAVAIGLRLPREISWPLLMSSSLAAGTVIAVALPVLAAAVEGQPMIDAAKAVAIHEETQPGALMTAPPVRSLYQTDSAALRLRWPISWARRSAQGVAYMTGVNW